MLRKPTPISLMESTLGDVFDAALREVPRMDRVRFITHHGKQILFINETNCGADEVIELLTEVQRVVTAQPPDSVLTLSDLTGAQFSRAAITRMKEVAVFDRPYVRRAAMVGAESLPKVFYEALKTFSRREFPRFKTREEAMGWLIREDGEGEMSSGDRTSPGRLRNASWARHRGAA